MLSKPAVQLEAHLGGHERCMNAHQLRVFPVTNAGRQRSTSDQPRNAEWLRLNVQGAFRLNAGVCRN